MRVILAAACAALFLSAPVPVSAGDTKISKKAYLYIGWPRNGQVLKRRKFKVWFGLRHAGVAPAEVEKANTGHHHLIVDAPLPPFDEPIPTGKNHIHFGGGQTETILNLPRGRHTLQLLFADHDHIPHNPPVVSKRITITVK